MSGKVQFKLTEKGGIPRVETSSETATAFDILALEKRASPKCKPDVVDYDLASMF
jgi:hypothetical protein